MAVGDAYVFPGFLTPVLTELFFPKPPTFLTCFCRGERRKYAPLSYRKGGIQQRKVTRMCMDSYAPVLILNLYQLQTSSKRSQKLTQVCGVLVYLFDKVQLDRCLSSFIFF